MTTVTMAGPTTDRACTDELRQLLELMRPEILAFSRRRIGADRAEDILSDVQLAAIRAQQAGTQLSPGWLMTVTRYKLVDFWRRLEREDRLISKLKGDCPEVAPAGLDDLAGLTSEVAMTLAKLRPRCRSILVRHYVVGVPVGDLARDEGVSYTAMESAMARARRAFRASHSESVASTSVQTLLSESA